jgi:hypothetical protein
MAYIKKDCNYLLNKNIKVEEYYTTVDGKLKDYIAIHDYNIVKLYINCYEYKGRLDVIMFFENKYFITYNIVVNNNTVGVKTTSNNIIINGHKFYYQGGLLTPSYIKIYPDNNKIYKIDLIKIYNPVIKYCNIEYKFYLKFKYEYAQIRDNTKELKRELIEYLSKPERLMAYLEKGGTIEEWNALFE